MSTRILPFEAIENFRDYGDYATVGGARLAPGRLLRSGHHARASEADLERLAALELGTVVDLRRASERAAQPSRRPLGFTGRVIESGDTDTADAPHITLLKTTDLTEETVRAFMLDTYRGLPFDPRHVELFSAYFEALAEGEGAVLIHCAAGKDRTGFLAALTHLALGVHQDDVLEDYLLTNMAVRLEARIPEIAEVIQKTYGRKPSLGAVRAFLGVEPAFLEAAMAEIEARHGGVEGYLSDLLGVDAARRRLIERRLVGA
jgi:protein tyrosine/serine phosphatase